MKIKKQYLAPASVLAQEQPASHGLAKTPVWLEPGDFPANDNQAQRSRRRRWKQEEAKPYVIVGFDTEYKTPGIEFESEDIHEGRAKYQVLSYQFHCESSEGAAWSGIWCPDDGERITLGEFLVFALGKGRRESHVPVLPTDIILGGHFTRADIPAFADFQTVAEYIGSVRNTFISLDQTIPVEIKLPGDSVTLRVKLRDTMLLSPAQSKSLAALGELVGIPKIKLSDDPVIDLHFKQNMDLLRDRDWHLFRRYALNDAVICVEYIKRLIAQYYELTGKRDVPPTLTSIGVSFLLQTWEKQCNSDRFELLGQEEVVEQYWDKKLGYYRKSTRAVPLAEVHWANAFVTECYHGGRNEQFWFGPSYKDCWTDYDLSSAYPTAMSLIGKADWRSFYHSTNLDEYGPTTLGFVHVDFAFPDTVRFPTLPVRTAHGLIFPRRGSAYCAAPELHLARALGAQLTIRYGVIVPTDDNVRVFGGFIKDCLAERAKHPKKSLQALFWKELSNSTYGKTAQGLHPKRVYDMRDRQTKLLPPSPITNAYFAGYITSYVRAVLGEIINALPDSVAVFSCTTDGFLTNASAQQIEAAQAGTLSTLFRNARDVLTGMPSVLEVKHRVGQLLGWKTRGQATLIPGNSNPDDPDAHIVLAKSSIYTPPHLDTDELENAEIVRLFFERTPDQKIAVSSKTSLRDMLEYDADLVEKKVTKRLNMEFDWKRAPLAVGTDSATGHLLFSTRPWETIDDYHKVRDLWEEYGNRQRTCLKTEADFRIFQAFVEMTLDMPKAKKRYLRVDGKLSSDLSRLRMMLCSAWRQGEVGFPEWNPATAMKSGEFAQLLSAAGLPTKRSNVEYGLRRPFVEQSCPRTAACFAVLHRVAANFPAIDMERIFFPTNTSAILRTVPVNACAFVERCVSGANIDVKVAA